MDNFPANLSDVIQYEVEQEYTRDEVTFTSGSKYALGDILELSTGKYVKVATAANAAAICVSDEVDASKADAKGAVISRGPAIVRKEGLNYNGKTEADVDAALLKLGIKVVKASV